MEGTECKEAHSWSLLMLLKVRKEEFLGLGTSRSMFGASVPSTVGSLSQQQHLKGSRSVIFFKCLPSREKRIIAQLREGLFKPIPTAYIFFFPIMAAL